ncbi:probable protein-translocating porin PorT (TC 1.B.44.1.1) [Hymenobacter roseosalivarius DSM 11622]|uniref:Probable protein-translocating porin PorT (TC 1.B.44.1.1) n=1 Tax=Hymenobacter roseosalivarius DSM 11622 TaxID=645990 RepID=A0A1W1W3T1_9BACT|nr:porin family protein [Hymenobacter roseosalivarius]SMC00285.1 probable protein-translocating porin PorT (TC 1.B.44.1.1) [Hymenobacter roseosalivarius DSM 11622]
MATPHVRHKLHLHGSKIICLALVGFVLLLLPLSAQAQRKTRAKIGKRGNIKSITVDNLADYDNRWFHPGFYVAPNFSSYRIEQSQAYVSSQAVTANSIISPGFSVGFVGDVRLANHFNLRFTPGVSFITRRIEFKPLLTNDSIQTQEIGTTQLEFPLLLKFRSDRRRNTRVYVVGGVKPSFNVGNRRKDPERNLLLTDNSDIAIEYGVGLDLFYPLFKFAPELRFSHGLTNLLQPGSNVYSRSLQSMRAHTVTLYLTFE